MAGRKIVIGVDGSDNADRAFFWALDNVVRKDDEVIAVHAAEVTMPFTTQDAVSISNCLKEAHKQVDILVAKYAEILKKRGIAGKSLRVDGEKPGEAVIKAASTHKADLIVTGTRGLGTIRRTILGSVSDYIIKHASVPVTVYKE